MIGWVCIVCFHLLTAWLLYLESFWWLVDITTDNSEILQAIIDSAVGMTGIAVAGYTSGDGDVDGTLNLDQSGSLNLVNIDTLPGNMKG